MSKRVFKNTYYFEYPIFIVTCIREELKSTRIIDLINILFLFSQHSRIFLIKIKINLIQNAA